MATTAKWTWLVYMAGDNNLEGAGREDLAEMKRIGSTDDVNVLVQFDTEENRTTRYRVLKGKLATLQTMPGVNCGDPKVLTDFLKWGMQKYPAERYLVDVWNHGGGWENLPADYNYDGIRAVKPRAAARQMRLRRALFRTTIDAIQKRPAGRRAIAIDCGSHDYLDNQELRTAIAKALPKGRKVDLLGCDACLMNMLEIAYEMKDTASFMVGSEETEPGAGWPYAAILKSLVAKPTMTGAELSKVVVVEYGKYFKKSGEAATQSALDLAQIGKISEAVNALAEALMKDLANTAGAVVLSRDRALKFEMPEYIDLGDFAVQLMQRLPSNAPVKAAATAVLAALNGGFVIEKSSSLARLSRATGVSIYFPSESGYAPDYSGLRFSKDGKWRQFLEAVFKA